MDEEEMTDETAGALGAVGAVGGIDFAKLKSDPMGLLQSVYAQQQQAEQAREATAKSMYDEAAKRIAERNAGMTTSEQLLAISQALLAPRKYRGFAGTLGKLTGAFGNIAQADRKARLSREDELAKLRETYMMGMADRGVSRAKTAADLVKTAASLRKDTRQYDPQRGIFVDKANIRPTQNTYDIGNGRTLVQWQDGLWREELPDGGYKVFERVGISFNEVGVEKE